MRSKVVATVIMLLLGVCMLVFIMVQTQNYASIINDAGVVRGATQRAVKLEIAGLPNEDVPGREPGHWGIHGRAGARAG